MRWLVAIVYHPIMIIMIPVTLLLPLMMYSSAMNIVKFEIPVASAPFFGIAIISFLVYVATRSRFFGKPYRKITILLPLLQMCIYTSIAINIATVILNKWADEALYSKGWAIALALIGFVVIRLLMSLLYWKNPIVQREN
ncbi:hypothetical protein PAECIP111893_01655 [Paenibacillus plantiphilus]|uniref:Uncharacterized protein n=1 Tax=Paenibacillus plantiphilus TaxID=2905650 RepID=A0ABN8GBE6_9BACL|nr:hypothetical protein [Paenibacillus plantiphilus]CAH1201560.1 hypothetical protein PAECIP111893_01655 [Paenibacillus plantiphilus]